MKNDPHVSEGVRLQKVLSQAGIASRRAAEDMILAGRVSVDGVVVRKLGTRIDPEKQTLHVDGERVLTDSVKRTVLAFNKPVGVVSTMSDPEGRPCLSDYLSEYPERLYHVGRLDIDTSGLLLLTNDGELANRLTHPSYQVAKTYVARVHGEVKPGIRRKALRGVDLEDGHIQVDAFSVKDTYGEITTVEITVHEGRNRLVRRLMDELGFPVRELVRIQFGPVRLDRLQPGVLRRVKGDALSSLYNEVDL
ncbi:rRNA pseudouridine synthase [Actinomycetaceae bacterium WB03_NA08]|uniref:Pseudouridine synthase n=1 Tax=Scrofimicrobium canadense TaxID=2652290 RepID=A0A6N7VQF1_9ACTO|nr:pseudouridine synthase [Scrofimicrobium canadense]MSS83967.1 rRNA pseudouridine synthase [Scrofimicrobium canadense]